jgi:hypothetical protein
VQSQETKQRVAASVPTDLADWQRAVTCHDQADALVHAASATRAAVRECPIRALERQCAFLADRASHLVQKARQATEEVSAGVVEEVSERVREAVAEHLPDLGVTAVRKAFEEHLEPLGTSRRTLAEKASHIRGEEEAAARASTAARQRLERLTARWVNRWILRGKVRKAGMRAADARLALGQVRLRKVQIEAVLSLVEQVYRLLAQTARRLEREETSLQALVESAEAMRERLDQAKDRRPHYHVEPRRAAILEMADTDVFTEEAVNRMVREAAHQIADGTDGAEVVGREVGQAVENSAERLPGSITDHLMRLPSAERGRLFDLLVHESNENLPVDVLKAPGNKRWRLRQIAVPGGVNACGVAEPLGRLNGEGLDSRIVDNADPSEIVIASEERGLASCQIIEFQRAEALSRRASPEHRRAAVTVWPDVDEVLALRAETNDDPEVAERVFVTLLATETLRRDGGGFYRLTLFDGLDLDALGLPDGRIAKGLKATTERLTGEPMLRKALQAYAEAERKRIGDQSLVKKMRAMRRDANPAVPAEALPEFRRAVTREIRRLAKGLDGAEREWDGDTPKGETQ